MKSLCALFLVFVLVSSVVFAQNSINSKPEAKKVDEFGMVSVEHFDAMLDSFIQGYLEKDSSALGLIVNYGEERQVTRNERIIKDLLSRRNIALSRIILVKGGFLDEIKTEIWLIPAGAQPPKIAPRIHKIDEIGKISKRYFTGRFNRFLERLIADKTATGYIINYGRAAEVSKRERLIRDSVRIRSYDATRIVIVNGGEIRELKTVFWLVPEGVEPPTP